MAIAKKHKLYVIEDAAHAIGTEYKGKKIGNFGDVTIFSFYVTKTITTGEGGMIVTNNEHLSKKLKRLSYFGIDKDAFDRYSKKGGWYYEIIELGYKYNMDNIQGALGVEQLKRIKSFIEGKRKIVTLYNKLLKDVPGITIPKEKNYTKHSHHLYPILVNKSRDDFIKRLKKKGIGTSVHFIPLHIHPYYKGRYKKRDFPIAEYLFEHEVSLPLYYDMTNKDVDYVANCIKEILE